MKANGKCMVKNKIPYELVIENFFLSLTIPSQNEHQFLIHIQKHKFCCTSLAYLQRLSKLTIWQNMIYHKLNDIQICTVIKTFSSTSYLLLTKFMWIWDLVYKLCLFFQCEGNINRVKYPSEAEGRIWSSIFAERKRPK